MVFLQPSVTPQTGIQRTLDSYRIMDALAAGLQERGIVILKQGVGFMSFNAQCFISMSNQHPRLTVTVKLYGEKPRSKIGCSLSLVFYLLYRTGLAKLE